jgi:hypothetical protein
MRRRARLTHGPRTATRGAQNHHPPLHVERNVLRPPNLAPDDGVVFNLNFRT